MMVTGNNNKNNNKTKYCDGDYQSDDIVPNKVHIIVITIISFDNNNIKNNSNLTWLTTKLINRH